jgi:hypothetical protein
MDSAVILNTPSPTNDDHQKEKVTQLQIPSTAHNDVDASVSKAPIQQQKRPRATSDVYTTRERRVLSFAQNNEADSHEIKQPDHYVTPIKKTRVCPCTVQGEQYFHVALNETYKGSVEAMFELLFNSDFLRGFLERYENFAGNKTNLFHT